LTEQVVFRPRRLARFKQTIAILADPQPESLRRRRYPPL